jgi:hypothetical protein
METVEGNLLKMQTTIGTPVEYVLPIGEQSVSMNELIGKELNIQFNGTINCIRCGKKTKSSFSQGFCYNCFQSAPEADESIIRPELSKAHLGIARDIDWAEKHDLINHYIYLAVSSSLKVGVTRYHQIPTRWIDQGASSAIKLAETPNRHIAGIIEVFLKTYVGDRTNWRAMLQNKINNEIDLLSEKKRVGEMLPVELQKYICSDDTITNIQYPVNKYPDKITSLSLDKTSEVEGILDGIKGQYLIFEGGKVLNIRKHAGYYIKLYLG